MPDPSNEVSAEDVKNYYESNKDKYSHVRIHEISFPDTQTGNKIKEKAENGEEFQNIANSYPDIEVSVNDIGYNRELARHFKNMEIGTVSEVIGKPDGTFSVLKIVKVKEIPFNKTKSSIKYTLEARQKTLMYERYAQKAKTENNIEVEIIEQNNRK